MNKFSIQAGRRQSGFSIPEIMIAILVFAIGMLALSFLQTALTRGQADANARAVASNLAERIIERAKGFSSLGNADGSATVGGFAYNEITQANITAEVGGTVPLGGIDYTVTPNVVDYRWNGATFVCYQGEFDNADDTACIAGAPPTGASPYSDYKRLEVTVSWDSAGFLGEPGDTASAMDTDGDASVADVRSVVMSTYLSSVTAPTGSKIQNSGNQDFLPPIAYQPGQNPDVIAIALGESKFKESTVAEPTIDRSDYVQTTWDVVTYSTSGPDSSFLRREEFRAVNCECTLRSAAAANAPANRLRPVVWGGDEYVGGNVATKQWGEMVDGSPLCDRCCQDHHDGGSGVDDSSDPGSRKFTPFRSSAYYDASSGNHIHYKLDNTGNLTPAGVGDDYLEACRLVRVDGYWRVGQDLRQEDRYVFPEDWLDSPGEIQTYSEYIAGTEATAGAVEAYQDAATGTAYETSPPCIGNGSDVTTGCVATAPIGAGFNTPLGDGEFPNWTTVQYTVLAGAGNQFTSQQLRARGLYIDYMSDDLRSLVDCLQGLPDGATVEDLDPSCKEGNYAGQGDVVLDVGQTLNALEIMPFFDTQITKLSSWTEDPTLDTPIDISSDPIEDGGTHDRGIATPNANGDSEAIAQTFLSNLALLGTQPYVPNAAGAEPMLDATLDIRSVDAFGNGGGGGTPVDVIQISGLISIASDVSNPTPDAEVEGLNGAVCDGNVSSGWTCYMAEGDPDAQVRIFGYGKASKPARNACSVGMTLTRTIGGTSISQSDPYATFELGGVSAGAGYNFFIQEAGC